MEPTVIDSILNNDTASAVDLMKATLSNKALDIIDAKRQAVSQQMFGDSIGAESLDIEDEIETEEDYEDEVTQENQEEVEDETDNGTD